MNGANVNNTGKYAIAGGNIKIVHLCEQNHSTFNNAYKTSIEFHKNQIFHYFYESKIEQTNTPEKLVINLMQFCIYYGNYEIFLFLEDEKIKIDSSVINASAEAGNLYLVKYFRKENEIPNDILLFSVESGNHEIVKYILEHEGTDINAKDIYLFYLEFILII